MSRSLKKKEGREKKKGPENLCSPGLNRRGDPVPWSEGPRGGDEARLTRGGGRVWCWSLSTHACQYGEGMEGCIVRGGRGVAEIADRAVGT